AGFNGNLYVFDGESMRAPREKLPIKLKNPGRIYHYPGSNLFYIHEDEVKVGGKQSWIIVDEKGNLLFKFKHGLPIEEIIPLADDTFITAYTRFVYLMRYDIKKGKLELINKVSLPSKGEIRDKMDQPSFNHLQYDERTNDVFVTVFSSGEIHRINMRTLKSETLAHLKKGVRFLAHAPKYNVICAGNYLTGDFSVIDQYNGDILYNINIGSRLRGVTLSRDGERVYAVSRGGVFEVNLSTIKTLIKKH
ncbi:MAG: hypothetical protein AB1546_06470, partial [bacterium]